MPFLKNTTGEQAGYDPNRLLDVLIERIHLKNDAALSRFLEVQPPVLSKLRHRRLVVTPSLLLRIHDKTALPIAELRAWMGVPHPAPAVQLDAPAPAASEPAAAVIAPAVPA